MIRTLLLLNLTQACKANLSYVFALNTKAGTRTEPTETETLKLRDTRFHEPKIRKYKNDSNTLEYGLS